MTGNIKDYLKQYCPAIFLLLEDHAFSWTRLDRIHQKAEQKREDALEKAFALKQAFNPENHFFDIVEMAVDGNSKAANLLDVFGALFETLSNHLDEGQRKSLRSTIYSIFSGAESSYLNFVGELLVLNQLLNSKLYGFVSTAFPIGNGNDADFRMLHLASGRQQLVEVLNIHLNDVADDHEMIRKFLTGRLSRKIDAKRKADEKVLPFTLVPVVWGNAEDLKKLSAFYKKGNIISVPGTLEAVAYCTFYMKNGPNYRFGTVSSLFELDSGMPNI